MVGKAPRNPNMHPSAKHLCSFDAFHAHFVASWHRQTVQASTQRGEAGVTWRSGSERSPRARRVSRQGGVQVAEALAGGATGVVLTAGPGGDGDLYDAACKLKVPCRLYPGQERSLARWAR